MIRAHGDVESHGESVCHCAFSVPKCLDLRHTLVSQTPDKTKQDYRDNDQSFSEQPFQSSLVFRLSEEVRAGCLSLPFSHSECLYWTVWVSRHLKDG